MDSLDSVQRHLLESICNVHLSDNAWLQASLPVKSGGLGIRSFAMLAPSAFLASAAGSSDLTKAILPLPWSTASVPFSMWQCLHGCKVMPLIVHRGHWQGFKGPGILHTSVLQCPTSWRMLILCQGVGYCHLKKENLVPGYRLPQYQHWA